MYMNIYVDNNPSYDLSSVVSFEVLSSARVSEKVNSLPMFSVLTTLIVSLCALIISFVIAKPRPVPCLSLPLEVSAL